MTRYSSAEEYLSQTSQGWWASERFLVWRHSHELRGFAAWGACSASDAVLLVDIIEEDPARQGGGGSLADLRRLEGIAPGAFEALAGHVDRDGSSATREAVLRPAGPLGALIAGFAEIVKPSGPWGVFTQPKEAFEWLGWPDVPLYNLLDEFVGSQLAPPEIRQLRGLLRVSPAMGLIDAAGGLRCSPRTLQRLLGCAGTTFQAERDSIRMELAREALATTASLSVIALDIGFSSSAHFSSWFRRHQGLSPSSYRATIASRPK